MRKPHREVEASKRPGSEAKARIDKTTAADMDADRPPDRQAPRADACGVSSLHGCAVFPGVPLPSYVHIDIFLIQPESAARLFHIHIRFLHVTSLP